MEGVPDLSELGEEGAVVWDRLGKRKGQAKACPTTEALMRRREILAMNEAQQGKTRLGGTPTAFGVRSRAGSFDIVEHCHTLGLGGVQTMLQGIDPEPAKQLRKRVESYGMQLILETPPFPGGEDQSFKFGVALQASKDAGAFCLHAAMTERRYEQFDSLDAFRRDFQRCQNSIALAEPVLRKHQIKLAIENHKGWRAAEQAAWLRRLDSEWVGVCLDLGNNMALCEDPMDTVKILAPYTFMCHIKEHGRRYL